MNFFKSFIMKGALGLLVLAFVAWGLWMSWEWLRNPDNWKKKDKNNNKKED